MIFIRRLLECSAAGMAVAILCAAGWRLAGFRMSDLAPLARYAAYVGWLLVSAAVCAADWRTNAKGRRAILHDPRVDCRLSAADRASAVLTFLVVFLLVVMVCGEVVHAEMPEAELALHLGVPLIVALGCASRAMKEALVKRAVRQLRLGERRLTMGLCPVCEYNLTGLPEPRCPECGEQLEPWLSRMPPVRR